jgi:hypothetical protein
LFGGAGYEPASPLPAASRDGRSGIFVPTISHWYSFRTERHCGRVSIISIPPSESGKGQPGGRNFFEVTQKNCGNGASRCWLVTFVAVAGFVPAKVRRSPLTALEAPSGESLRGLGSCWGKPLHTRNRASDVFVDSLLAVRRTTRCLTSFESQDLVPPGRRSGTKSGI